MPGSPPKPMCSTRNSVPEETSHRHVRPFSEPHRMKAPSGEGAGWRGSSVHLFDPSFIVLFYFFQLVSNV